jgi:hypothetical protein
MVDLCYTLGQLQAPDGDYAVSGCSKRSGNNNGNVEINCLLSDGHG